MILYRRGPRRRHAHTDVTENFLSSRLEARPALGNLPCTTAAPTPHDVASPRCRPARRGHAATRPANGIGVSGYFRWV
jgi:hypothetical protein